MCEECYKAELSRKNKEQAEANKEAGLVALEGSEKQVLWAESIRADVLKQMPELQAVIADARARIAEDGEVSPKAIEAFKQAETFINSLSSRKLAKGWIEAYARGSRSHKLMDGTLSDLAVQCLNRLWQEAEWKVLKNR